MVSAGCVKRGLVFNPCCCHMSDRTRGRWAKSVFPHKSRVSPLHLCERQRSEVKPIMASKKDGDIRSAEVDEA